MSVLTLLALSSAMTLHEPGHNHAAAPRGAFDPQTPRYVLDLSLEEFSVLHSAAGHGVKTYGGHAEFKVDITQAQPAPIWKITIDDPKLLSVWGSWMNEKTAQLVNLVDVDALDEPAKKAFRITRSVNTKLKEAQDRPVYDPSRARGVLGMAGSAAQPTLTFKPDGSATALVLTGPAQKAAAALIGKSVMVEGVVKKAGEIEATAAYVPKDGVLEVFVIAHCPFGKAAQKAIIERLRSPATSASAPRVEFRYLFIPIAGQAGAFTCLHGENEARENVVQMVIRDMFEAQYYEYLLKRAVSDAPWEDLAKAVGLDDVAIATIEAKLQAERGLLMGREYAYGMDLNVPMLSPTYVYEGRVLKTLDEVPAMKGITLVPGSCGG